MNEFDKISEIFGRHIDKAFKDAVRGIVDEVVSNGSKDFVSSSGEVMAVSELQKYFLQLSGITADINFLSKAAKEQAAIFLPEVIAPSPSALGVVGAWRGYQYWDWD